MKARDFLVGIFRIKDIQAGNTTTARQIMSEAEQRIPIEFAAQPELRDELLATIESVNRNLDRGHSRRDDPGGTWRRQAAAPPAATQRLPDRCRKRCSIPTTA